MNDSNIHLIVDSFNLGERLDKFLHSQYPKRTRSFFQNLIKKGDVRVNGEIVKAGYSLKIEDNISIQLKPPESNHLLAENIPLDIVYEDEYILVVNKQAGLVVHPGAGNRSGTLVNALLHHTNQLSNISGSLRPGIVHRLDKNTSGLIVVAKKDECHAALVKQFETREIERTYNALVWGVPDNSSGEIETYLDRSRRDRKKMAISHQKGKLAITTYRVLKSFQYFSLLELSLRTGRTHQIRVHLNHIHHPIFGDPDYNGRKTQLLRLPSYLRKRGMDLLKHLTRQALHAKKLSFIHPKTGNYVNFESSTPDDLGILLEKIPKVLFVE